MAELPELDPRAFGVVEAGFCSITQLATGRFVRTPWVVPQQPLGHQNFQLHESALKQMALALGLVDRAPFDEEIDKRDAKIEELEAALRSKDDDMNGLRWAAERYYASEAATGAQQRRSKNEEKIQRQNEMIADRDQRIRELEEEKRMLEQGEPMTAEAAR